VPNSLHSGGSPPACGRRAHLCEALRTLGQRPQRAVARRPAIGASLAGGRDERGLDGDRVGCGQVFGHHGGHLGRRESVGEGAQHFDWVVGGWPAREGGVQVGDNDVVGLDRLKALYRDADGNEIGFGGQPD
jgi:hypothetical protein